MLNMYKQITVQTLFKQGVSKAAIARQLGCNRHTVTRILKRTELLEKQTRRKPSVSDSFQKQIADWLKEKISRRRIYEKLQTEYGLHTSYINICKYMQKHFPRPSAVYGVQLTAPGEEAELDFGYLGKLPGKDGKLVKTWGIEIILSYSRAAYYGICYDQKLGTLISEVQKAFAYFNGVPRKLKVDNMKTAVICNRGFELEFNQEFLEFAQHYNFVVVPCTPYSPEQKGKVEAGIKYGPEGPSA
jgi:transposase